MGDLVHVMVVGPTTLCSIERIIDTLDEWRMLVGGTIGSCSLPPSLQRAGFYAFCNDDGVGLGLPDNHYAEHLGHAVLKGAVVIFRRRAEFDPEYDGDAQDMSTGEVLMLTTYLAKRPTAEAKAAAANERRFWDEHPSGIAVASLDKPGDFDKWIDELFEGR